MVTSFSLGLLASYYYTTNLTVVNSVGISFDLSNVVLDTTRSLLYLQNCGHAGGCIINDGTLSRCPVGWKQKAADDYVNLGISECISVYDNISVGSTTAGALPATLYADNGIKVANLSALNVTQPGALTWSGVSTYTLGGLLGLAFPLSYETAPSGTVGATFFTDSPLPWLPVTETVETFALDLNGNGQDSSLLVGGYDPDVGGEIQWGLTQAGPDMAVYHVFNIFDLQLCGANMLGRSSSNWLAVVDTLSPCLTLPAAVFDSLRSWALNSTDLCHLDLSRRYLCYLPSTHPPSSLPTLTFRLNHTAPLLHLPLSDLLLDDMDSHGRRALCVLRGPNLSKDVHEFTTNPLVFGTLALRSLYTVIDLANTRVGMANKASSLYKWTTLALPTSGCASLPTCVGQQHYQAQDNSCRPPPCADYLYQEVGPDGTHCRFTYKAQVAVALLALSLVTAELVSHTWRWRAAQAKIPGRRHAGSPSRSRPGPAPSLVRYLCTGLLSGVRRRRRRRGGRAGDGDRVGLEEDVG